MLVPTSILVCVDIPEVPGCQLLQQSCSQITNQNLIFFESNAPDICALCKTNLEDTIDFSVRCYLPSV